MARKASSDNVGTENKGSAEITKAVTQDELVPMGELLARIAYELASARVRHRALLTTLLEAGLITWEPYAQNFARIRDEDLRPLMAHLALEEGAFMRRFERWARDDLEKYQVKKRAVRAELRPPASKRRKSTQR